MSESAAANQPRARSRRLTIADLPDLLARFRAGERRALARLLTQVENDTALGREALRALFAATGRAHVVGVTGPPGAGKSTLVNRLITTWREQGQTVAVVAVDPSSSLTGGATLGDRVRMMETWADDGVFIRSMATRGALGGLASTTRGIVWLLDAFGFTRIIIETVGVGQDEVEIAQVAQTTLLLQVPGLGDDIQAIKAGVLEIADLLVVNKADRPGVGELKRDLALMLSLNGPVADGDWRVPICETIAAQGVGVAKLVETIERHREAMQANGSWQARERAALRDEVLGLVQARLLAYTNQLLNNTDDFAQRLTDLVTRTVDPITVADEVAAQAVAASRAEQGRG